MDVFIMDTSGWIEFFRKSEVGDRIRELVIEGDVLTPTVVLGELRKKYIEEGYEDDKFQEDYETIQFMGEIVDLSPEAAIKAGEMRATCGIRGISLVDCVVITLACMRGGKAISTDKHFRDLEDTIYISVEED